MAHRAPIDLTPYSPDWPRLFVDEHVRLTAVFPEPEYRLDHIGSTSVPGLGAKPIIDILVGAPSLDAIEQNISALEGLGYEYVAEAEAVLPQRRFFANPTTRPRQFHVHAVAIDSEFWLEHILFRDALRSNSDLAAEYLSLKQQLAARFGDDRAAYTEGKAPFIRSVISRASHSRAQSSIEG